MLFVQSSKEPPNVEETADRDEYGEQGEQADTDDENDLPKQNPKCDTH